MSDSTLKDPQLVVGSRGGALGERTDDFACVWVEEAGVVLPGKALTVTVGPDARPSAEQKVALPCQTRLGLKPRGFQTLQQQMCRPRLT